MAGLAWAQSAPTPDPEDVPDATQVESYDPAYFEQFAPQTAADMVSRVPGFEIRGGGGGRGFGQASLNILINGRRPSSKSSAANEILARIPADNVIRIDIVDGGSLDIPGLSGQVANIIAKSGELSGSWNYAARFEEGTQPQLGDGGLNFSAKRGRVEAVGSLGFSQFTFTEDGDEGFFDADGTLLQDRVERISFNTQNPFANLNLTVDRDNGHIANLNLSGSIQNRNTTVNEIFTDLVLPLNSGGSIANVTEDFVNFEIGGDYDLGLDLFGNQGRLKLIALYGQNDADFISRFRFNTEAPFAVDQLFDQNNVATEYIGRAEYNWKAASGADWVVSLEGALNVLDSETAFSVNDGLPNLEDSQVEEERYQVNLSRTWSPTSQINLQASLGAEYSVIDVVSADLPQTELFRPNGEFTASYQLNKDWILRGTIERSVDQLDFGDFVSTVSLAEGTGDAGNDRIVPAQNWQFEIEAQRQVTDGLSGRITAFYDIIEDPIELILFEDGTQGPGNLDSSAQVYGLTGNLTWVLDNVAKGLRVTADAVVADSVLDDPIISGNRPVGRQAFWDYQFGVRYDIDDTPFALETKVEQGNQANVFRIDERIDNLFIRPEFEIAFVHKNLFGLQWTLRAQNLADFTFRRTRNVFDGTRAGDFSRRETTDRQRGRRFSIEVTDTF